MNPLVFDVEASGAQRNKANPFDPRNKLMSAGFKLADGPVVTLNIEHGDDPYGDVLAFFQRGLGKADLLVGFNLKFDMHWMMRYGIKFDNVKVWDCQLFHFIMSNQTHRYPSLNDVLAHYELPQKLDVVKTEYWDNGLDTDQVPWEILKEYGEYDVEGTYQVFLKQQEEFQKLPKNKQNLILLHMEDLLSLQDMEYAGFPYDVKKSLDMGDQLERDISDIDTSLSRYVADVSISFNSDRQLSSFLYGGKVVKDVQEPYTFHYKDGRTAEKVRWVKKEYVLPRILEPLKGTENNNGWSVGVDILKTLLQRSKGFHRGILEALITRSKLEKRKSTYCRGTPKLLEEMQWENQTLHPNLNQCVAVTGRLSCDKPNLQNQDGAMRICFPSRFPMRV